MEEYFQIDVEVNGQPLEVEVKLQPTGYIHRFVMNVKGEEIAFEPDEEKLYRAMISPDSTQHFKQDDMDLIQAVIAQLNKIAGVDH